MSWSIGSVCSDEKCIIPRYVQNGVSCLTKTMLNKNHAKVPIGCWLLAVFNTLIMHQVVSCNKVIQQSASPTSAQYLTQRLPTSKAPGLEYHTHSERCPTLEARPDLRSIFVVIPCNLYENECVRVNIDGHCK